MPFPFYELLQDPKNMCDDQQHSMKQINIQ